jgi:hypothetical protein
MKPHLRPVSLTDIPRADAEIQRTIETLRAAQFEQDPLFDAGDSFAWSLRSSAVKREGRILEAAIMDAVEQTDHLRLLGVDRKLRRVPDVQFEIIQSGWIVVLEVKRGTQHDAKSIREFRKDLDEIPPLIRSALPLFPVEHVHFHIVFVSGKPRIKEGLTPDDLSRLYDLHIRAHILTARQRYSGAIKIVLRERGL